MGESFTHEMFEARVKERFDIVIEDGRISCELAECSQLKDSGPEVEGRRQPFSLIFAGPADPVLPQATYRLENDEMGPLDVFLVPIGQDGSGVQYQAVFA